MLVSLLFVLVLAMCVVAVDRSRGRGGAPAAQRARTTFEAGKGSAAYLVGQRGGKDVAVQVICCLPWENVVRETSSRVPAPSLTRKSDGEWAAEGIRRSRVMWYCCGLGSGGGIGDDGFTGRGRRCAGR